MRSTWNGPDTIGVPGLDAGDLDQQPADDARGHRDEARHVVAHHEDAGLVHLAPVAGAQHHRLQGRDGGVGALVGQDLVIARQARPEPRVGIGDANDDAELTRGGGSRGAGRRRQGARANLITFPELAGRARRRA